MRNELLTVLIGLNLDEEKTLSLAEMSRACAMHAEWVVSLVEEGVLEPSGRSPANWRFSGACLRRALSAARLQHDLGINLAGVALVLDLIEEMETLRKRLRTFEHQ
jgi:chaperone modulatory protein CbpM